MGGERAMTKHLYYYETAEHLVWVRASTAHEARVRVRMALGMRPRASSAMRLGVWREDGGEEKVCGACQCDGVAGERQRHSGGVAAGG